MAKAEQTALSAEYSLDVQDWLSRFQGMASFWSKAAERVRSQEAQLPPGVETAVYGAGFYGAFVVSCLNEPQRVVCHLDQNVYLQGRDLNGRPILSPAQLPEHIQNVWVGLNPTYARQIVSQVGALKARQMSFLFLE
jgi:hypothetical protein